MKTVSNGEETQDRADKIQELQARTAEDRERTEERISAIVELRDPDYVFR